MMAEQENNAKPGQVSPPTEAHGAAAERERKRAHFRQLVRRADEEEERDQQELLSWFEER
jgi:hypothetical protein